MPPADASPDVVLDAYLRAQKAGDCDTARSLQIASQAGPNLCGHITAWTPPRVANTLSGSIEFSTTITMVGSEQPFHDGDFGWNYSLRQQADGSWRVSGSGDAP